MAFPRPVASPRAPVPPSRSRGRRAWLGAAPALAALAALGLAWAAPAAGARADGERVRVFAPGPKLELDRWLDSRESYRQKMRAIFDRRLRGQPGVPLIQRGADDVASHLLGPRDPADPAGTARDLVVWPESVGLFAGLGGAKGAVARDAPGLEPAFGVLLGSYAPEISYYSQKYPQLAGRTPQIRLLGLALTDRFGRVAVETFTEIAAEHRVWMVVGVDMAREWQVVCADREALDARPLPGGVRCDVEDPGRVETLRAPDEPGRDYAYEATSPDVVNMALVIDPLGRIVSRQVKAYLTPPELPGSLDLVPGEVSGLGAVETPVGTLGVVISKDAWMPDVQAKLDLRGVDLLTQPELFFNDTVRFGAPWAADTLRASGYNAVLRRPSFEALVLPELTGNVYEFSADAQSHIATRARGAGRPPLGTALIGQPPQPGFAQVSRWIVPDDPAGPIAERRALLAAAGERMLPAGPACPDPAEAGPCENGQVEDVIRADVEVARRPPYRRDRRRRARTPFPDQRPLAPSRRPQRNASVATRGRTVLVAFEQEYRGRQTAFAVRSADAGRTFTPRRIRLDGSGRHVQLAPTVALAERDRAFAAWVDERSGAPRVLLSASRDGGRSFDAARSPGTPGVNQWAPSLAPAPGGGAHLAWIEESDRSADDDLPQARVMYARISAGGTVLDARRLDQGEPAPFAAKLHNAWAPDVAARGERVSVAWVDFRSYDWRPYVRTSTDGGRTFGPERSPSAAPPMTEEGVHEQIADAPRVAIDTVRDYVTWSDWRKHPDASHLSTGYDAWLARRHRDEGFEPERRADNLHARQASAFWPDPVADAGDVVVVWQTSHDGVGDIRIRRLRGGRDPGLSRRVDDTRRAGINQYRPRIARSHGRFLVAWEDERDGPAQIYLGRADRRWIR